MEAYTISERKYKLKPQSELYFPVIIFTVKRMEITISETRKKN